mmetsp:Transcript_159991/g.489414  ORF Transcript_159991/g.489414 Transcript_159991/m.489414 type:complete len:566 (+) Transcript_159991:81-1778(+)
MVSAARTLMASLSLLPELLAAPSVQDLAMKESAIKAFFDAGSEDPACFDGDFTRERCCPGLDRPYGDWLCWSPPYTHMREDCCDIGLTRSKEVRIRAILFTRLGFASASSLQPSEVLDGETFGVKLPFMLPVSWAANVSQAQPLATMASLLRALRPRVSPVTGRRAYAMFLAVERPLLGHLGSGWPVFALMQLLIVSRYGRGAHAGAWTANDRSTCLACGARPTASGRSECILACAAAAREIPTGRELLRLGEGARSAAESLRDTLLRHCESSLRSLGVGAFWELGQQGLWGLLHELQVAVHHRGACPDGRFLFRTNAEPAYSVCLPLLATARGDWVQEHLLDVIVNSGRWRDCDTLHSLAGITGSAVGIDVGFNIGACTAYMLAMGLKVHALDPEPDHLPVLRGALWKAEEEGRLVVHFASASDLERPGSSNAVAPTVRLDRLLDGEQRPLLLKIDVEGDEQAVLRGAWGLFQARRVRAVTLELHRTLLMDIGVDPFEPLQLLLDAGLDLEVLPWHYAVNESMAAFKVASSEDFSEIVRKIEATEGPNFQVLGRLPESLWNLGG